MTFHPDNTFSPADAAVLSSRGYCIGYDLDGNPERAMAVHPETGMIIRTFWSGCSIWHPAINRMSEKVSGGAGAMDRVLCHTAGIKRNNQYTVWHNRSKNWERLAALRNLANKS